MADVLTGRCFCGGVAYRVTGPPTFETSCHCTICRRTSGAPYVTWFTVSRGDFAFTAGLPAELVSSSHGARTFCASCGTPLTFRSSHVPDEIDVTTCSLDEPERVPPRDHTHVASKVAWVRIDDGLPRLPGARGG